MKRRTLDLLFSFGGVGLAVLFIILGLVMTSNANFSKDYVRNQLRAQQITFKPAAALTAEERKAPCLVKYAGQPLETGKQAECYANSFIGLHTESIAGGKTYATLGDVQTDLKGKIAAAQKGGDTAAATDLNNQLTTVNTQRETLFKGETLRGGELPGPRRKRRGPARVRPPGSRRRSPARRTGRPASDRAGCRPAAGRRRCHRPPPAARPRRRTGPGRAARRAPLPPASRCA